METRDSHLNPIPVIHSSEVAMPSTQKVITMDSSPAEDLIQECRVDNCPLYSSQDSSIDCSTTNSTTNTSEASPVGSSSTEDIPQVDGSNLCAKTPDDSETCSESLSSDSAGIYSAVDFVTSMGRLLKSCESSETTRFNENNSCSASLASEGFSLPSMPPDDSDRHVFTAPHEAHLHRLDGHAVSQSLFTTVKKLEARVESLTDQLARLTFNNQVNAFRDVMRDEQIRAQREKCVVLKCIPETHLSGELLERISTYFQIPRSSLQLHVMDRYKGWCVVLIRTPSRHHASLILHNFADFRQTCEHYHRTQALPSYSRAEQMLHQELWAEAIKRNNRAGFRLWEVRDLKLVEVSGEPKPWHVKVHYFPDEESANAPISANDVRKKQRQNANNPNGVSKPSTSNVGIPSLPTSTTLTSSILPNMASNYKPFDMAPSWMSQRQNFGGYFKPPRNDSRLVGGRGFRDGRKKSLIESMSSYFEHNNVRSKFEGFGDQNNNFVTSNSGSCRCSPSPCAKSCAYNCQRSLCHEESRLCQQRCCNKPSVMPTFNQAGPSTTNNWFDFYQSSSPTPIYNFGSSPYVTSPGPQFPYTMQPVMQYTSVPQQAPCPVVPVAPMPSTSTSQPVAPSGTDATTNKCSYG
uniref:Uncharacterized protein n=1 Tax=Acrobeloides nanus TaxID=290746 RepID=A0A914D4B6_9BILA